jgi:hypothetical protein
MNPVVGRILRSQLQKLDLPMRTPQDTIHARNYRREDKTDGVCDCNALIRFKSSEEETKEKVLRSELLASAIQSRILRLVLLIV